VRLAVLVLALALVVWLGVWVAKASGSVEPALHEVRAGDTVWGIAEKVYGDDVDLRRAVHEIEEMNQLRNGHLDPGDTLMLPAREAL
jgi:nucleoid-associated protein YgaU